MGEFADYLGQYLDNTIIQLSKIASECAIFADQCVLNGFAPPHPGDLQRILKEVNWQPKNPDEFNYLNLSHQDKDQNNSNSNQSNSIRLMNNHPIIPSDENNPPKENLLSSDSIQSNQPESLKEDLLSKFTIEDIEKIKNIITHEKDVLSQVTIDKIHTQLSNFSKSVIVNFLKAMIAKGEINNKEDV